MTRKLDLYKKYHEKYGVSLNKMERSKILQPVSSDINCSIEYLLAYKMHDKKELDSATKI